MKKALRYYLQVPTATGEAPNNKHTAVNTYAQAGFGTACGNKCEVNFDVPSFRSSLRNPAVLVSFTFFFSGILLPWLFSVLRKENPGIEDSVHSFKGNVPLYLKFSRLVLYS